MSSRTEKQMADDRLKTFSTRIAAAKKGGNAYLVAALEDQKGKLEAKLAKRDDAAAPAPKKKRKATKRKKKEDDIPEEAEPSLC